jgi:hypothetical protein
MPGSVENAVVSTVLPWSLCKAFAHSREYIVLENQYLNGERQAKKLVLTSRKSWATQRHLTAAILLAFANFYDARKGPEEAFWFYDPWDAVFTYDPTGTQTLGRYTVRFDGTWEQMCGAPMADINITLIESA